MIPTRAQCLALFDRFSLPSQKKIHVEEVTRVALYLADKLAAQGINIDRQLLEAAALLHDIDKNIPRQSGERHPDTAVRVLLDLHMPEVAEIVRKHSLHLILDPDRAPQTWEEKLVYLSDKMTKYEFIGVEHRFKLWYKEQLPAQAVKELDQSFPKVKALEQEVLTAAGITFSEMEKDLMQT